MASVAAMSAEWVDAAAATWSCHTSAGSPVRARSMLISSTTWVVWSSSGTTTAAGGEATRRAGWRTVAP